MDCLQIRNWMLDAEYPQAGQPAEVAGHLQGCAACRRVADQLARLEAAWRALPPPAEAERSKHAFLAHLASNPPVQRVPPRVFNRRRVLQWCTASAAGLLAMGGGGWLFFSARPAQADDDLLDHLVDWNLQISGAQSQSERARRYDEQADGLRATVARTNLPAGEAGVVNDCLDNGAWLVSHIDPIFEADRFLKLADRLLQLADATDGARNPRHLDCLLRQHNRLLEAGVEANIDLTETTALDPEHEEKLEQLIQGDAQRTQKLAGLSQRAPTASLKEIERAFHIYHKRQKRHHHRKAPRNAGKN